MPDRANATLQSAKRRSGLSYQKLANQLGVSKGVLWNYMVKGIEPEDLEIRRRLNIGVQGEWIGSIQFVERNELGQFT